MTSACRLLGRKWLLPAPDRRVDVAGQTAVQVGLVLLLVIEFGRGAATRSHLEVTLRVVVETFTSIVLRLHQRVIMDQVVLIGKL